MALDLDLGVRVYGGLIIYHVLYLYVTKKGGGLVGSSFHHERWRFQIFNVDEKKILLMTCTYIIRHFTCFRWLYCRSVGLSVCLRKLV